MQGHDDKLRLQTGHLNLLDTERTEVEDVSGAAEPHNAQSRGVAERSEALHTHEEPPFREHFSDGEAPVPSNSKSTISQLVHDDIGIKAHSFEAHQDIQRIANQWYNNDEDDNVQTATRKAEEQMRSADDALVRFTTIVRPITSNKPTEKILMVV